MPSPTDSATHEDDHGSAGRERLLRSPDPSHQDSVGTGPAAVEAAGADPRARELLRLQRSAGNRAAVQLLTQRGAPPEGRQPVVLRQVIDSGYDNEIFEVEAEKRRAEVSNLRAGGGRIGPLDPRRQHLEGHFADPANRKGDRSYPAIGPAPGGPRRDRPASEPATTLPGVLVVGPDATVSPRLPEQADGEHAIQAHFDRLTGPDPTVVGLLDPIRLTALSAVNDLGRRGVRKVAYGVGQANDNADLTAKVAAIVATFERDATRAVEQRQWESTVEARAAFVASKADQPMAAKALDRAKQDVARAGAIYDGLYQVVGFDVARVDRLAATATEDGMLDLRGVIPAPEWPAFLMAATTSDELLTFAVAHKADLTGVANAASVMPVWQANPVHVRSVADADTILGLALVTNDVAKAVVAASLLGTPQVPDIAALTVICAAGVIPTINNLRLYVNAGGDPVSNKEMRALPEAPTLAEIKAFNAKVGRTPVEAAASWTALKANVTDDQKRYQIIKSIIKVEDASLADFTRLVTNWVALSDRTTITSGTVASLVKSGLLVPRGKVYDSGTWGRGCVYVFNLAYQGRLFPEWHLHFQFGRTTTVAGAGWKNQDEKYGSGVKTFGSAPALEKAISDAGYWLNVRL